MYEGFIDVAKKYLFHRVMIPSDMPVLMSGDIKNSGTAETMDITSIPKSQHLTCFVGGMIGLGARIFDREEEMRIAIEMTNGCVWSYNCTASGIGPEIFQFVPCGGIEDSRSSEECSWDEAKWKAAVRAYYHSTKDNAAKKPVAQQQAVDEDTDRFIQVNRLPPGMVDVPDRKYILRPEAIESVFIMYRLTGDATWMDKAWDMFLHIEAHTRTKIASASLADVTLEEPRQIDSMESFWLAETLKYFFLIYSDWDVVDLDEWVLNTEAHPLRRMDVQS